VRTIFQKWVDKIIILCYNIDTTKEKNEVIKMRKEIIYNNIKLEIVATRHSQPFVYYDFKIYELREKKHWWNRSRVGIVSDSTYYWTSNVDFETKIMDEIKFYYQDKLDDNVESFFQKNS
jgi:hypothetical protein